jgi:tRNA(Ser,Leu) C12 N-acetylase TAN1
MAGGVGARNEQSGGGGAAAAAKRSRSSNNDTSRSSTDGHKRPKHGSSHARKQQQQQRQPKRGGPGFLLTCEAGRESRCRGEGLDLIRHYYYYYYYHHRHHGNIDSGDKTDVDGTCIPTPAAAATDAATESKNAATPTIAAKKELSLEEEIALLQSGASADDVLFANDGRTRKHDKAGGTARGRERVGRKRAPFAVYDTGCKGTVIVLCTLPDCRLVDPDANASGSRDDSAGNDNDPASDHSVARSSGGDAPCALTWDPVEVMEQVIGDMIATSPPAMGEKLVASEAARDAPSTRHVTRLVPLQATCFAAMEDIIKTAKPLVEKYLISEVKQRQRGASGFNNHTEGTEEEKARPTTFEIVFKRRFNSKVRRDPLIDALAEMIDELRKSHDVDDRALAVDLKNPDYSIQIEVIQNICGMSVIPGGRSYRKFNLVELMESGRRVAADNGSSGADDGNKE